MDRETIANALEEKHQQLFTWVSRQDDDKWETGPEGKWTTGQHVLHLLQSIKPLNAVMSMPKYLIKYKYGTVNRELRDYDAVVYRYLEKLKLKKGEVSPYSQHMKIPKLKEKNYLLNRLQVENKKLQYKVSNKWSDKQLDTLVLPHPLMGKMPVRELVMWMAYHTEHHTKQLIQKY